MSALSGAIGADGGSSADEICRAILSRQSPYFSASPQFLSHDGGHFGGAGGRPNDGSKLLARHFHLLVALDGRIDNRSELIRSTQLEPANHADVTDAQLVAAAWLERGEESLTGIIGDFALAIFDSSQRQLFLARDPSGQRPLFYAHNAKVTAFASMPSGILAHASFRRGLNFERIAAALLDVPQDTMSYFVGIHRVRPGECVAIGEDVRRWVWWRPALDAVKAPDLPTLTAGYRSVLDEAVRRRMPSSGRLACHLSAGLDSNGVASTAARLSTGQLLAFTAAPARGFSGDVPKGRMADESHLASLTARRHKMDHRIVHGGKLDVDFLRRQARVYQDPARNLLNGVWWSQILHSARDAGAGTLLVGSLGNVTLNFGGLAALSQWVKQGRVRDWAREARGALNRPDVNCRGVLFNSFGPWLGYPAWSWLRRHYLAADRSRGARLLRSEVREKARQRVDDQPSTNLSRDRLNLIAQLDPGMLNKGSFADAGIVECDPLADRNLIEFSLTLPPEAFLHNGVLRPLAHEALSDRVPSEVLHAPLRGLQSADWRLRFTAETAMNTVEEIEGGPATELLDFDQIRKAIRAWPESRTYDLALADMYSRKLPMILAAGIFMNEFASAC
jgi:asparagine synthase (glutamine-hydrolysing)